MFVFYWLLNMSLLGGLMGLPILLLRRLRRMPRFVSLWLIPFLRLWLPYGLRWKYSLMTLFDGLLRFVPAHGTAKYVTAVNAFQLAQDYAPLSFANTRVENVLRAASAVWLLVAAALLLTLLFLYIITARELRGAPMFSDRVTAPMVFGILRPRVLLPLRLREEDTAYILLHEQAHIRYRDNLWRLLGLVTCCVHWFNPLCWLFLRAFFEDIELRCDEAALRACGTERRRDYARALLREQEQRSVFSAAFGGAKLRVRVAHILQYRKLSLFSTLALLLFFALCAAALLTNGGT